MKNIDDVTDLDDLIKISQKISHKMIKINKDMVMYFYAFFNFDIERGDEVQRQLENKVQLWEDEGFDRIFNFLLENNDMGMESKITTAFINLKKWKETNKTIKSKDIIILNKQGLALRRVKSKIAEIITQFPTPDMFVAEMKKELENIQTSVRTAQGIKSDININSRERFEFSNENKINITSNKMKSRIR